MTCIIFFLQLSCCRRHKARAKKKRYQRREKKRKVEALNWMCVTCDSTGCFFSNDEDSNQKWRSVVNNFVFAFPRSTTCFAKPLLNHWCRNTLSWNGSNNDDKKKKESTFGCAHVCIECPFYSSIYEYKRMLVPCVGGQCTLCIAHTICEREHIIYAKRSKCAHHYYFTFICLFVEHVECAQWMWIICIAFTAHSHPTKSIHHSISFSFSCERQSPVDSFPSRAPIDLLCNWMR